MSKQMIRLHTSLLIATMASLGLLCGCEVSTPEQNVDIIDTLQDPIEVVRQEGDRLVMSTGEERLVPGLGRCLNHPGGLQSVLDRGLELSALSPRLYCLVPVFHRCGNDPIREHVERVDLADLVSVINAAVDSGSFINEGDAFMDDKLQYTLLDDLLTRHGIQWDERSPIDFP